jgi:hypothetical protein
MKVPRLDNSLLEEKIKKFRIRIKNKGVNYGQAETHTIERSYISADKRASILQNRRSEVKQQQSRSDLCDLCEQVERAKEGLINKRAENPPELKSESPPANIT